jgi:secreted PhoX family phosphatase
MMLESSNNVGVAGGTKTTLIAKIDNRVVPALDRVADSNQVNTAQLMRQFLGDVADCVEFLDVTRGDTFNSVEDRFARLIVQRCHGATPEALQAVGRIWHRAAELKAQEGGAEG